MSESAECTPSELEQPLPRAEAVELAALLKALGDPTRLQLVALIGASPNGEACVCDLAAHFDISQPTISHHLKVLAAAGLVERDKRGLWAWYSLAPSRADAIRDLLRLNDRPMVSAGRSACC